MGITLAQIKQMGGTPVDTTSPSPTAITPPTPIAPTVPLTPPTNSNPTPGLSLDQIKQMGGTPEPVDSFGNTKAQRDAWMAENDPVKKAFDAGIDQIKKGADQANQGRDEVLKGDLKNGVYNAGSGILNETMGGVNTLMSPVSGLLTSVLKLTGIPTGGKNVGDLANEGVNKVSDFISNSPELQKFVTKYPGAVQDIPNLIEAASLFLGAKKAPEAGQVVGDAIDTGTNAIKDVAGNILPQESQLPQTFYHGADSETAGLIKSGGFKGSQDFPGNGMVSLTESPEEASGYANINGKGEVLPVQVNAQDIKEYPSPEAYSEAIDNAPGATAGEKEMNLNAPYDAIRIKQPDGTYETLVKPEKASVVTPKDANGFTPEEAKVKLQGVADDWKSPTDINKAGYNNARAVLAKDPEIPNYLAQNGLNPYTHIEDGVYDTKETAQLIRDDAGKLSADSLRPSLEVANAETAPVQIDDLKPSANMSNFTVDDESPINKAIQNKLDALQEKYPNGMKLTDMLDEKIKFDKNGGYNPFKTKSDNIDAVANRALADELRGQLDANAPANLPVKEFNAQLSKNYRMADYLDALNGKKAPVSVGQTVARLVTKFGFAKLGSLFGGDIVSAFGGYQIGKIVESFAENLTNPARDAFLQNIKITNPEAFQAVQKYMSEAQLRAATSLKLPAGEPIGTDKNPIITPAPTTYEAPAENSVTTRTNKTGDVFQRDLKTGKMKIIPKKPK